MERSAGMSNSSSISVSFPKLSRFKC